MATTKKMIRPSDIATMAGVSPAAVANWRDRHKDTFPKPIDGTAARPLYDYDEIVSWLRANGKTVRKQSVDSAVWVAMESLRGAVRFEDYAPVFLSLLTVRKLAVDNEEVAAAWDEALRVGVGPARLLIPAAEKALHEIGRDRDDLLDARILESVDARSLASAMSTIGQIAKEDLAQAGSAVLTRFVRSQARAGGANGAVGALSAQLMASLATRTNLIAPERSNNSQLTARSSQTLHATFPEILSLLDPVLAPVSLYDSAAGICEGLFLAHRALGNPVLVGREFDASVLRTARQRAFLADIPIDLARANTISEDPWPDGRADAVIVEPPFGLRLTETLPVWDRRWQYGTPSGSMADFAWIQDAIAHLAPGGRGYVLMAGNSLFKLGGFAHIRRALITSGVVEAVIALPPILNYSSIHTAIWVLRDATNPVSEVTLIDVPLDGELRSVRKPIADLLADTQVNLVPRQWLAEIETQDTDFTATARQAAADIADALRTNINAPALPAADFTDIRVMPVSELATIRRGSIPSNAERDSTAVIRPRHVAREGLAAVTRDEALTSPDRLTRPGDVLVVSAHEIHAIVDAVGGHAVGNQVTILTANAGQILPEYLAAAITGQWNNRFMSGTAIRHANPRELEIPVPTLEDQQRIVDALGAADEAKRAAAHIAATAEGFTSSLLNAVRYGADLTGTAE